MVVEMQIMRQIRQGLQDVVGYCKQEVGGQQPAEAEHAVAQWQRDSKLSGKTSRESEGEFIILIITVEPPRPGTKSWTKLQQKGWSMYAS